MSRYADSDGALDTVFDIKPVDDIDSLLSSAAGDHLSRPHNAESNEKFEQRILDIPGVSSVDFTKLLIALAQPSVAVEYGTDENDSMNHVNAFSPAVHDALIVSTRVSSSVRHGSTEYNFIADDTAKLIYSYEYGQPSSFHFRCDDQDGDTLQLRGSIDKAIELEFPRHAVTRGIGNDVIDITRSFPLTLKEMRYIREIFSDEIKSMSSDEADEVPLINADEIEGTSIDTAVIEVQIDNQREEAEMRTSAQLGWLNIEYANLLDIPEDPQED